MFLAPHHIALDLDDIEAFTPYADTRRRHWTWICGHRFDGVRWL